MNSKIDNLLIYDALNYTNRRSTLPYGQYQNTFVQSFTTKIQRWLFNIINYTESNIITFITN